MPSTLQLARADFLARLSNLGVGAADVKSFLDVARPALLFRPAASDVERNAALLSRRNGATNEDNIPLGASKAGGRPDLPAEFSWPGTQSFVVQFDLSQPPPDILDIDLPREGQLLLFVDPDDVGAVTLAWIGPYDGPLGRREAPDEATLYLPRRLAREIVLTLDLERPEVPAYDPRGDDMYDGLAIPEAADSIQLGGDAQALNGGMRDEIAARSGDTPDGMSEEDAQWRLVLRVGSIEECEMAWGGNLFVWMRLGDIRERRFENAVIARDTE